MREASAAEKRTDSLLRAASLICGVAAFLAIVAAAGGWLLDSVIGLGTARAATTFASAVIGLVGASLARHRPVVCVAFAVIAGVGLLAVGHIVLGLLMLAGGFVAGAGVRASGATEGLSRVTRRDVLPMLAVVGVAGLAVVAGVALLILAVLLLAVGLSGSSSSGIADALTALGVTAAGCAVVAFALIAHRARTRNA